MKYLFIIFIFIASSANAHVYADIENVIFKYNYDGDTVTVDIVGYPEIIGKNISVRVNGVDTPELHGKCIQEIDLAKKIKEMVRQELVGAQVIILTNVRKDKYFRINADIIYDGKSLREFLLLIPNVHPYHGEKKINYWCK